MSKLSSSLYVGGLALAMATCCTPSTSTLTPADKNDNYLHDETIKEIMSSSYKAIGEASTVSFDKNVIKIDQFNWSGTALILLDKDTDTNYGLTAEHVLVPGEKHKGNYVTNQSMIIGGLDTEVVKRNSYNDLGLVKILDGSLPAYTGKIANRVDYGDFLIGVGYPRGGVKTFTTGRVSAFDSGNYTIFDGSISPGNSGGGMFNLNQGELHLAGVVQILYTYKKGQAGMSTLSDLREFIKGTELENEYL